VKAAPAAVFSHGAALGRELQEAVTGRITHTAHLAVGVTMVVPKPVGLGIHGPPAVS
jgi:hypothetical protein